MVLNGLCISVRMASTGTSPAPRTVPCMLQLFQGDTNRRIAETPMNQVSSRSHCIFTVHLEARKVARLRGLSVSFRRCKGPWQSPLVGRFMPLR
jgi:hypothetical protein